ncbi:MAG: hypothetical protein K2H55_04060, partial [Helicobacter sp.]|nr:hypothetical protein [Helicobacter sp.]
PKNVFVLEPFFLSIFANFQAKFVPCWILCPPILRLCAWNPHDCWLCIRLIAVRPSDARNDDSSFGVWRRLPRI